MQNPRCYGPPPYRVALLHGGPGAGGEMAPVARVLAAERGVLEPIQTANTVQGQVDELRDLLAQHATLPATLVGYSWGAWLGVLLAARHPALVRKLVLVSSGAFEAHYVAQLHATRMSRLDPHEQAEFQAAIEALGAPTGAQEKDPNAHLERLGALAHKADSYDPWPALQQAAEDRAEVRGDIYQGVWPEAAEMRRSGELLALAGQIACPVTAIHGDHDPSPAEGVRAPLSAHVARFAFVMLERCGHTPWQERHARDAFYDALRRELVA